LAESCNGDLVHGWKDQNYTSNTRTYRKVAGKSMTSKYRMWEKVQERHAERHHRSIADEVALGKFDFIEFWETLERDNGYNFTIGQVWEELLNELEKEPTL
jgi:hypothetical protein